MVKAAKRANKTLIIVLSNHDIVEFHPDVLKPDNAGKLAEVFA